MVNTEGAELFVMDMASAPAAEGEDAVGAAATPRISARRAEQAAKEAKDAGDKAAKKAEMEAKRAAKKAEKEKGKKKKGDDDVTTLEEAMKGVSVVEDEKSGAGKIKP